MKESDIRPKEYLEEQRRLFEEDIQTFLSDQDKFVEANCPACGSEKNSFLLKKYTLPFSQCHGCRTVYMNPRPTMETLVNYYSNSKNYKFWVEKIFPASEKVRRRNIFIPRVKKVISHLKELNVNSPKLVEIGSGFGIFAEEANNSGFFNDVTCVEPTPFLAEKCKSKGLNVIEKFVEEVELDEKVDVIVNFEVIEHLLDPLNFLKKCNNLLNDSGILYITCPNFEGFDILTLGNISDQIDVEHINLFNLDSFETLLKQAGFKVVKRSTPGKLDVDIVHNKIKEGAFKIDNNMFLNHLYNSSSDKARENFQTYLSENELSSNMEFIAIKE